MRDVRKVFTRDEKVRHVRALAKEIKEPESAPLPLTGKHRRQQDCLTVVIPDPTNSRDIEYSVASQPVAVTVEFLGPRVDGEGCRA